MKWDFLALQMQVPPSLGHQKPETGFSSFLAMLFTLTRFPSPCKPHGSINISFLRMSSFNSVDKPWTVLSHTGELRMYKVTLVKFR